MVRDQEDRHRVMNSYYPGCHQRTSSNVKATLGFDHGTHGLFQSVKLGNSVGERALDVVGHPLRPLPTC
ncbi:unnamed protein product [Fusarium graminearum]|nr:unnamed protein product [Fusarium graminearum]VTO90364.1 unnamed protein product [Fusarium graminearum]